MSDAGAITLEIFDDNGHIFDGELGGGNSIGLLSVGPVEKQDEDPLDLEVSIGVEGPIHRVQVSNVQSATLDLRNAVFGPSSPGDLIEVALEEAEDSFAVDVEFTPDPNPPIITLDSGPGAVSFSENDGGFGVGAGFGFVAVGINTTFRNVPDVTFLGSDHSDVVEVSAMQDPNAPMRAVLQGFGGDDVLRALTTENGVAWVDGGVGDDFIASFQFRLVEEDNNFFTITIEQGLGDFIAEGGIGDDMIVGGGGNNILSGGAGNDSIAGFGEFNILFGGTGDDRLHIEEAGSSQVFGDEGDDAITLLGDSHVAFGGLGQDDVTVRGNDNVVFGDLEDSNIIPGVAIQTSALTILDEPQADVIFLTGDHNVAYAQEGDDTVTVMGNFNTVFAGAGEDRVSARGDGNVVFGDAGGDGIDTDGSDNTVFGGAGDDQIQTFGQGNFLFGDAGDDVLIFIGSDNYAQGGDGDDVFDLRVESTGNESALVEDFNVLYGNDGNDLFDLRFDEGLNIIEGGEGLDTFLYGGFGDSGLNGKTDLILDFKIGDDGDLLDIRNILEGYDFASPLDDFIQLATQGSMATLRVNQDGQGTDFVDLVNFEGLGGTTLNDLLIGGNIEV